MIVDIGEEIYIVLPIVLVVYGIIHEFEVLNRRELLIDRLIPHQTLGIVDELIDIEFLKPLVLIYV